MPNNDDLPLCQLVAVLPNADDLTNLNRSGVWKVLQYTLLSQNSQGAKAAEAVQDALMTGVPYLLPFTFSRYEADSLANDLRALGYKVNVLDPTLAAAN